MTIVLRESSRRAEIICSPLIKTNADVKNMDAPMTGAGIAAKTTAVAGTSDSAAKIIPMAYPILRLVTPVAPDSPTDELKVLMPIVPTIPQNIEAKPFPDTPPTRELKLRRNQSLSLRRCALDTSPTARREVALATTPNDA